MQEKILQRECLVAISCVILIIVIGRYDNALIKQINMTNVMKLVSRCPQYPNLSEKCPSQPAKGKFPFPPGLKTVDKAILQQVDTKDPTALIL